MSLHFDPVAIFDAHILSEQEKKDYFQSLRDRNKYKIQKSIEAIDKNKELLVDAYWKLYYDIQDDNKDQIRNYGKQHRAWEDKICQLCGSKLKYIDYGGYSPFWGCLNYKDGSGKHTTVSDREPTLYLDIKKAVSWLTNITIDNGFKGTIRATELYNFYMDSGFEDIRLFYAGNSSEKYLNIYRDVKKNSNSYERKCYDDLKQKHDTVLFQLGIRYESEHTGGKSRYCFLDLLASDKDRVYIYECKTNDHDTNDTQRNLYCSVMYYLLHVHQDERDLSFEYLIQKPYDPNSPFIK